ncbi:hypothetical protein HCN44_009381 [Aphidius gifuensis]|uniref:Protein-lysine N-methyltransferase SMYD4 n=1 Tax=Aphidius gifuensis TaxID=684658 RepID=A0A835CY08_APHGI|nr:hypothetical protein HCN44_009381 [Aphidius gifuensis]
MMFDDEDSYLEIANYFRSNLVKFRKSITPEEFKYFSNINSNSERVAFVLGYPEVHDLPLEIEDYPEKNLKKANEIKENGNINYANGNFLKALELYSEAILISPKKDLGIFLANRSAALYNLEFFDLALSDANEAIKFNYPKELFYKLEERKARCYLGLKNNKKAIESFRRTLQALDDAKLPFEKKQKLIIDVRMMMALMEKGQEIIDKKKLKNKINNNKTIIKNTDKNLPKINDVNLIYPSCSSAIEIRDFGGVIGRHAVARRDIKPGELLIVDKPFCTVLLDNYRTTNCQYCLKKNIAPYPASCDTCTIISYCSTKCRDADAKTHVHECDILAPLWLSNASLNCLLSIKAITQKPYDKFQELKDKIIDDNFSFKPTKDEPYKSHDYMAFKSLVTHENERTSEDLLHRAYMAAWLLRVLKKSTYLPESSKTPDTAESKLTNDELFFGEKRKNDNTLKNARSNFIAGGLYTTAALLNHSCNPGIARYYVGTTMIVKSIKTITKGSEICDNYGPIFTTDNKQERQRKLRLKYWFDCSCEACIENWPLLENIDPRILRFKCETGVSCGNILMVNIESNEFMIGCSKCRKSTNIMKGLKTLQDTDALFKIASGHIENGNHADALNNYIEILKLLDETLALPIKDYHICQQGIKLCLLPLGNIKII